MAQRGASLDIKNHSNHNGYYDILCQDNRCGRYASKIVIPYDNTPRGEDLSVKAAYPSCASCIDSYYPPRRMRILPLHHDSIDLLHSFSDRRRLSRRIDDWVEKAKPKTFVQIPLELRFT